jgi:TetR/AcrR family transcriptional regulator, tetracycline repressor protein
LTEEDRRTGRAARPVRPALTREYIVRTALAIIDRDGLAKFSMRRLGTELGADPMAVYHYLPSKAALFDGVVETVYGEIAFDGLDLGGPWQEQVAAFMLRLREAVRRHPNALPVLSTRPAYQPTMFRFGEFALSVLTGAGFTSQQAIDIVNCLGTFTIGHVLAEVGEPVGGPTAEPAEVRAMVPEDEFPHLARAFADGYEYRPDEQYELGLRAMLDGFGHLL